MSATNKRAAVRVDRVMELYIKLDIYQLMPFHTFRTSLVNWTFFDCARMNFPMNNNLRLIFGKTLLDDMFTHHGAAMVCICEFFKTVMADIKEATDENIILLTFNLMQQDLSVSNLLKNCYMPIFTTVMRKFQLNSNSLATINSFFEDFFTKIRVGRASLISLEQFRTVFENLELPHVRQALANEKELLDIIMGRIVWFLFKFALDLIFYTVNCEQFQDYTFGMTPLLYAGSIAFEQLKPFSLLKARHTTGYKYKELISLEEAVPSDPTPGEGPSTDPGEGPSTVPGEGPSTDPGEGPSTVPGEGPSTSGQQTEQNVTIID